MMTNNSNPSDDSLTTKAFQSSGMDVSPRVTHASTTCTQPSPCITHTHPNTCPHTDTARRTRITRHREPRAHKSEQTQSGCEQTQSGCQTRWQTQRLCQLPHTNQIVMEKPDTINRNHVQWTGTLDNTATGSDLVILANIGMTPTMKITSRTRKVLRSMNKYSHHILTTTWMKG